MSVNEDYIKQLEETVANLQSTLDTTVKQLDENKRFLPSWSKHLLDIAGHKFDAWVFSSPSTEFDKNKFHITANDVSTVPAYITRVDKKYVVKTYTIKDTSSKKVCSLYNAAAIAIYTLYGPNSNDHEFNIRR